MIRDEVLRLAQQLRQLTDPSVTSGQLGEQLPALWVGHQLEKFWRRQRVLGNPHKGDITSSQVDGSRDPVE
jgi:hypothetical protein